MKTKHITLFSLLVILALFLGACTGTPLSVSWPGLGSDGTQAYISYGANIVAVNLANGTQVWKYPTASATKTYYAAPVITSDGQLLIGDYQNGFSSIDVKTGALKWMFTEAKGRFIGSPLVVGSTIYVPAVDFNLYALDLTGKLKWKFVTGQANWATPVSDGKVIYLASMDHKLYAINPENGAKIWSVDLGGAMVASPAIGPDGTLIAGTLGNEIVAVDPSRGNILWRVPTSEGIWGTPVINGNFVYVSDTAGDIYALDITRKGKIEWQKKPGDAIIAGPIIIPDGMVVVTESGKVMALDFTGNSLWTNSVSGKLYSSPILVNGKLLMAVKDGTNGVLLVALDTKGVQSWAFTPAK